jgi:hypothetical protein
MEQDTDNAPLFSRGGAPLNRRKPILDMSVNLGHLITMVMMLGGGMAAWNQLTNRQERTEQRQTFMETRQQERDQSTKETLVEIRADLKGLQRSVDEIKLTGAGVRR